MLCVHAIAMITESSDARRRRIKIAKSSVPGKTRFGISRRYRLRLGELADMA